MVKPQDDNWLAGRRRTITQMVARAGQRLAALHPLQDLSELRGGAIGILRHRRANLDRAQPAAPAPTNPLT